MKLFVQISTAEKVVTTAVKIAAVVGTYLVSSGITSSAKASFNHTVDDVFEKGTSFCKSGIRVAKKNGRTNVEDDEVLDDILSDEEEDED